MEQFNLEEYKKNSNRKVVTRRGNPVRIICTDRKHCEDDLPIVFLEEFSNGGEFLFTCRSDGTAGYHYTTLYDLFFADEEEGLTEFEKRIYNLINFSDPDNCPFIKEVKEEAEILFDLARKEIRKEEQEKLGTLEMPIDVTEPYYIKGKQDALKDLLKWKKITEEKQNYLTYGYLSNDGYYLSIQELKDKLPKE